MATVAVNGNSLSANSLPVPKSAGLVSGSTATCLPVSNSALSRWSLAMACHVDSTISTTTVITNIITEMREISAVYKVAWERNSPGSVADIIAPNRRQSMNDQESNSHMKPNIMPLSNDKQSSWAHHYYNYYLLFHKSCSRCILQPYDCVIIHFVE